MPSECAECPFSSKRWKQGQGGWCREAGREARPSETWAQGGNWSPRAGSRSRVRAWRRVCDFHREDWALVSASELLCLQARLQPCLLTGGETVPIGVDGVQRLARLPPRTGGPGAHGGQDPWPWLALEVSAGALVQEKRTCFQFLPTLCFSPKTAEAR